MRKLSKEVVMTIPELLLAGRSWKEVRAELNIGGGTFSNLMSGKSYKDLQPEFQRRMREVRDKLGERPKEWRCTKCGVVFPRTAEHFQPIKTRKVGFEARCRGCKSAQNRKRYIEAKTRVLRHYSGDEPSCACCGESAYEFLSIDHIDGGGHQHRKEIRKGEGGVSSIHVWLENNNYPPGFRVLCMNCNTALGFHGYCPHQKNQ